MSRWHYLGERLASAMANLVPRPLQNGPTYALATLCLAGDRRGRRAVYANLRALFAFAGRPRRGLGLWRQVWRVFINYGRFMVEFLGDRRFNRGWLARQCDFSGLAHVTESVKRDGACIYLSAHFGNWELAGAELVRRGQTLVGAGEEWPDERLKRLFRRFRANRGYYMYPYAGAAPALRRCLRRGGTNVFLLGDRNVPTDAGVEVEFLGRNVRFPRGPERLALLAGVPLVPVFARRRGERLEVVACEPIRPPPRGARYDRAAEVRRMAQAFARVFERQLLDCPHQWNGAFIEELGTAPSRRFGGGRGGGGAAGPDGPTPAAAPPSTPPPVR